MVLEPSMIVVVITVLIHFIAFIRVFTTLEHRLATLEAELSKSSATLNHITETLITSSLNKSGK